MDDGDDDDDETGAGPGAGLSGTSTEPDGIRPRSGTADSARELLEVEEETKVSCFQRVFCCKKRQKKAVKKTLFHDVVLNMYSQPVNDPSYVASPTAAQVVGHHTSRSASQRFKKKTNENSDIPGDSLDYDDDDPFASDRDVKCCDFWSLCFTCSRGS